MAKTTRPNKGWLLSGVLSLVTVSGCATGYHRMKLAGGYENTRLQDDIHQVAFYGNAYTHPDVATDFALLRAAEVSLEQGCPYFIVVEKGDFSDTSTHTTPVVTQTTGRATIVRGGQSYTTTKPSSKMLIRVLKARPADEGLLVYDAAQILENLREKHGLETQEDS